MISLQLDFFPVAQLIAERLMDEHLQKADIDSAKMLTAMVLALKGGHHGDLTSAFWAGFYYHILNQHQHEPFLPEFMVERGLRGESRKLYQKQADKIITASMVAV